MRRFQGTIFKVLLHNYGLPIAASSHVVLRYYLWLGVRSDFSPATAVRKAPAELCLLVSCRLLFRDAARFVVSPLLSIILAVSHISLLTRHLSPFPPCCLSFLHQHLLLSPICSKETEVLLTLNLSAPNDGSLSPGLSHPTLLLTSQPCTLQIMHL